MTTPRTCDFMCSTVGGADRINFNSSWYRHSISYTFWVQSPAGLFVSDSTTSLAKVARGSGSYVFRCVVRTPLTLHNLAFSRSMCVHFSLGRCYFTMKLFRWENPIKDHANPRGIPQGTDAVVSLTQLLIRTERSRRRTAILHGRG